MLASCWRHAGVAAARRRKTRNGGRNELTFSPDARMGAGQKPEMPSGLRILNRLRLSPLLQESGCALLRCSMNASLRRFCAFRNPAIDS